MGVGAGDKVLAEAPKLFVSYSWTDADHEAWVLALATDLRESGVDVILYKWDLKEGHDAHAFMEQMVTDPRVNKVILICDKTYVDKTDGRTGGVGTEAQIISSEIYEKQAQDKFVAIVRERTCDGKAYLPVYYRSRIYIDLSDHTVFSEGFEKLLRWAFDQPLYQKPGLGTKPGFLINETEGAISLVTSSRAKRAVEALRNGRPYAVSATAEYFDLLCAELEKFRIDPTSDPFDDAVVKNIASFVQYRDEAIGVFDSLAANATTIDTRRVLQRFFEQLIPYLSCPENVTTSRNWDWDNFRFIVHELFLYGLSSLIRHERFEAGAHLMSSSYYVPSRARQGKDPMVSFGVFRSHMDSLASRNQRLNLRRLSLRADLLKERCTGTGIEFRHIMQVDLVLFLRSVVDKSAHWFPETLLYDLDGPLELFARSRSKAYFDRAKILLGIDNKESLSLVLKSLAEDPRRNPSWQYESINLTQLLGFEAIATLS